MNIKTPKDISSYVILQTLKQALICLVPLAAVIAAMKLFGERIFTGQGQSIITAYVLVIALTLYFTKFPKRFLDSSWIGTITFVDAQITESRRGKGDWGLYDYCNKLNVTVTVKTDSGKEIKKVVFDEETLPSANVQETVTEKYAVGRRVFHVYGTKYVGVLDQSESRLENCIVCGNEAEGNEGKCHACGHSLHIGIGEEK